MNHERIPFRITRLAAAAPEGVVVEWQGRELHSGPLVIDLDESPAPGANEGVLDYSQRRAEAEFHVLLRFPDFARMLRDLGADAALAEPVRAVLRSEGEILGDHGFALSGRCELRPHALFAPGETSAAVLAGY
ncbi:MAG TPA: hypothetical protein VEU62_19235 [Bryobacterales bacterium]|nr:hypothetical protein [Bryobacterales bacterium]